MTALLEARALVKTFAGGRGAPVRAVDDVSFTVEPSGALGLVGESGSGKSTTARLVLGLLEPTRGSVILDGVDVHAARGAERRALCRRMQMVFQDPSGALDPRQTVSAAVEEPLAIQRLGRPRDRRVRALGLLEAVGLHARDARRYPHEFSGGQRQRIGIARALALEPELLVCDEPVSALDVSVQAQIVNLLKDLRERFGLAYLFVAHDLAVVRGVCDTIAVMYLGRIVEIAPRDELFATPRHPYTRALLSAIPVADPDVERDRRRILLPGDPPSPASPPSGCAFHPRCAERARVEGALGGERCARERPELTTRAHAAARAACHLDQA